MEGTVSPGRGAVQLRRLETLTDVVYAIVIWRVFMLIPRPGVEGGAWSSLSAYLGEHWLNLLLLVVGLAFAIIYWLQSNTLFGALERTDGKHTVLSIAQLFLLLIFLYSLRLGIELGGSAGTRAFESGAAASVGLAASLAWTYAIRGRRLLRADVTDREARAMATRITAEPITAMVTIPIAFVGPIFWELSWFAYPFVAMLARRRARNHGSRVSTSTRS